MCMLCVVVFGVLRFCVSVMIMVLVKVLLVVVVLIIFIFSVGWKM